MLHREAVIAPAGKVCIFRWPNALIRYRAARFIRFPKRLPDWPRKRTSDIADENITRCLFYIDLIYEDRELLVQQIAQLFPGEEMRFLFDTEYSAVYILE